MVYSEEYIDICYTAILNFIIYSLQIFLLVLCKGSNINTKELVSVLDQLRGPTTGDPTYISVTNLENNTLDTKQTFQNLKSCGLFLKYWHTKICHRTNDALICLLVFESSISSELICFCSNVFIRIFRYLFCFLV